MQKNIIILSIEVIVKISDALDINIDFLVGKTDLELDSQTLRRIEAISSMPEV